MRQITTEELFKFYVSTFNHCGEFLLDLSDEVISTYIFEEFDIDATTFLHHNTLDKLKEAEFIDEEVYSLSQLLREKFRNLEGTPLWNVESVKTEAEWLKIMQISDRIRIILTGKRGTEHSEN